MTVGPPGVPGLLAALSRGTQTVVVEPVHTARQAAELELVLWRIRGVRAVELLEVAEGEAVVDVGLGRPVALASDLRALFGRDLVDCRRDDGVLRVRLAAPPVPRAGAGDDDAARPLTGSFEPRVDPADDAASVLEESEDGADAPSPPVPLGASLRLGDPALLVASLDDDPSLLQLVVDHDLVLRAVHGGLPSPFGDGERPAAGVPLADVAPPHRHRGLADRARAVLRGTAASHTWTLGVAGRVHEVVLRPVRQGDRTLGCRLTVTDTTARHDDRELLRDLTEVFEVAFRESPGGQALLSPDGTVLRSNPALHRLLGRDADALRGRALADLLGPGDAGREEQLREGALRGDRERFAVDLDPQIAAPAGFGVRATVTVVRTSGGDVRGLFAHFETTEELGDEVTAQVVDGPW